MRLRRAGTIEGQADGCPSIFIPSKREGRRPSSPAGRNSHGSMKYSFTDFQETLPDVSSPAGLTIWESAIFYVRNLIDRRLFV